MSRRGTGCKVSLAAVSPRLRRDFGSGTKRFDYRFVFYARERNNPRKRQLQRFWLAQLMSSTPAILFFGIFQVYGQGAPGGGAPVVNTQNFNSSTPASGGATIGTVSATNSPKSWSITAGNSGGDFAISNSGVITFTSQGAADYDGSIAQKSGTLTVEATNASGSGRGIVHINAYADGSVNAPTGPAQYPTGLSGYRVRPPWKVAGFDYYVGIQSGTKLTPVSNISNPNVTISSSLVKCTGPNASANLNAIDFTGFAIYIPPGGCSSLTVTNSNFACTGGTSPGFTFIQNQNNAAEDIEQNKFNSYTNCNNTSPNNVTDIMQCGGTGNCTVKYNSFYHQSERAVDGGCSPLNYQFNLFDNPNTIAVAHENMLQHGCARGGLQTGLLVAFNSLYSVTSANGGEGWQFEGASGQEFTSASPTFAYNTAIALKSRGKNTMSYIVHGFCHTNSDCSTTAVTVTGTATFSNNYFDPTGAYGAFYPGARTAMWPSQLTFANNINMNTGTAITRQ